MIFGRRSKPAFAGARSRARSRTDGDYSADTVGSPLGHQPPAGAVALSEQFTSPLREVVLHTCLGGIAMMIGIGVGVVAAIIAAVTDRIRQR